VEPLKDYVRTRSFASHVLCNLTLTRSAPSYWLLAQQDAESDICWLWSAESSEVAARQGVKAWW
jgi:hypothetical protein